MLSITQASALTYITGWSHSKPSAHATQANFASSICSVCGMMYCPGQANDEKLHAAFHSSHLQGIRFQVCCLVHQTRLYPQIVLAVVAVLGRLRVSKPLRCNVSITLASLSSSASSATRLAGRFSSLLCNRECRVGRRSGWCSATPATGASCSSCRMTRARTSARYVSALRLLVYTKKFCLFPPEH